MPNNLWLHPIPDQPNEELTEKPTRTPKKRQKSSDEPSDCGTKPKKTKAAIMTLLECPVCFEVPRTGAGPILGCRNGHIICQNCVEKIEKCPTCREKEIRCRNIVAERYIETELKDVSFNCKNIGKSNF